MKTLKFGFHLIITVVNIFVKELLVKIEARDVGAATIHILSLTIRNICIYVARKHIFSTF
jgi:hypothetical protein